MTTAFAKKFLPDALRKHKEIVDEFAGAITRYVQENLDSVDDFESERAAAFQGIYAAIADYVPSALTESELFDKIVADEIDDDEDAQKLITAFIKKHKPSEKSPDKKSGKAVKMPAKKRPYTEEETNEIAEDDIQYINEIKHEETPLLTREMLDKMMKATGITFEQLDRDSEYRSVLHDLWEVYNGQDAELFIEQASWNAFGMYTPEKFKKALKELKKSDKKKKKPSKSKTVSKKTTKKKPSTLTDKEYKALKKMEKTACKRCEAKLIKNGGKMICPECDTTKLAKTSYQAPVFAVNGVLVTRYADGSPRYYKILDITAKKIKVQRLKESSKGGPGKTVHGPIRNATQVTDRIAKLDGDYHVTYSGRVKDIEDHLDTTYLEETGVYTFPWHTK